MADKIFSIADGLHDELPSTTTAKAGRILITTDRGEMYYEPEDKKRIQVNPQADWQQNDETANDYVKNRPGGYDGLTEILPETTLNFTSSSLPLTNCPPIEVGAIYTVTFDNTKYELVGRNDSEGYGYICIGNETFTWGGSNTGEPFIIYNSKGRTPDINISSSETFPCTHTIKIEGNGPIKIDEKYLDIKNTNIVNGSKTGSLRTVGTNKESSEYKIGDYAFAEGCYTKASGDYSHAEGNHTTAEGIASHAEGNQAKASGHYSHAEGHYTTASSVNQHVQGIFNIEDKNNTYADIIGNGENPFRLSNAATVDWQGNAWYAGDVYVGSTSGTNKDEGSKKLATENHTDTTFANALKGSKSGSAILIDDVSPVTHNMGVKVRGKNLLNQSTTALGTLAVGSSPTNTRAFEDNTWYAALTLNGYYDPNNNMPEYALNGDNIKVKTSTNRTLYGLSKALKCSPNTTYTLSYNMENGLTKNASGIGFYDADKKHISFVYCDSGSSFTTPSNCYWIIVCFHGNDKNTYVTYSDIQLELGTIATAYTPYVPDLTAVKVKKQGKNLLPPADSGIYYNGSIYGGNPFIANSSYSMSDFNDIDISKNRGVYAVIKLTEGETYTLTVNNLVNNCATKQITFAVGFRSSESTIFGTEETDNTAKSSYNPSSFTFTVPKGFPYCLVGLFNYPTVSGDTISFDAMQLELGAEATDYEPYITPTDYTPNADGTVEGVTSLYPNTTLTTDTEGVLIDCEYNRDINKAFAELQQAIISLGGNV